MLLSPSFWIESLKRMEKFHMRPLPCPISTDITTLPLDKLRDIAIHAYKLRKNWASDLPRPVRVGQFDMDFEGIGQFTGILCIPGTAMIVTSGPTYFVCWDSASGEQIGACAFGDSSIAWSSWSYSPPFHSSGMFCLGISSLGRYDDNGKRAFRFDVCVVDYRNPASVKTSQTFSRSFFLPDAPWTITSVVVNEDTIGTVTRNSDGSSSLIFCRIKDGELRQMVLGAFNDSGNLRGYAIDDDLCLFSWSSHHILELVHTAVPCTGLVPSDDCGYSD
ncbi:hypothetical protein FB45DRAFT_58148 [Roridomyces roridus]|uniref:Uncharacterized protein n=1 Tax=Roridomyces roridus TaxID=1738132 RepID=A0AAD7BPU7_9AGAR|nr:hypothetical protein FB45DRAFT_58148 [Roridomyces roridus]